jgi:hypothetical protein
MPSRLSLQDQQVKEACLYMVCVTGAFGEVLHVRLIRIFETQMLNTGRSKTIDVAPQRRRTCKLKWKETISSSELR